MEYKIDCVTSVNIINNCSLATNIENYRVYIYAANIRTFKNIGQFENCLSLDEKRKFNQFKFLDDQLRFLLAHGLLRTILGKYLSIDPSEIYLVFNEYGKPYLYSSKKIMFNITHSKDWIMIAFSKSKILGIDLEYVSEKIDEEEIIRAFFHANELVDFNCKTIEDRLKYFYYLWVSKEAYTKALGKGLSYSFKSFYVTNNNSNEFIIVDKNYNTKHKIIKFDFSKKYVGAVMYL